MHADPIEVLRGRFGFSAFRPGQEELVRAALSGQDALGVLPTGGGKSVCYQIPALMLDGLVLVITPLISLMEDQVGRARQVGLRASHLSSSQAPSDRAGVIGAVRAGAIDLLFVSPERLDVSAFQELLRVARISLLAVDEAHCISEWGHDFRPAYRRIGRVSGSVGGPTLALTATATPEVRRDIVESLRLRDALEVLESFARENLHWTVLRVDSLRSRVACAYRILRRTPGPAIVYAPTRRTVEIVRDRLAARGVMCEAYHAGLGGEERSAVQERFMSGRVRVVVATNAFGMGVDKADVRSVLHIQLPPTLEGYYQEAGRAGRDGARSKCIAFTSPDDRALGRGFVDRSHPTRAKLRRLHRTLRSVTDSSGVARVDHAGVIRVLGERPDEWIAGEPVGPLGALERIGAVRRLSGSGHGTGSRSGVSESPSVGVLRRADFRSADSARRRALAKLDAVERYAHTGLCRSQALLRYFGETTRVRCGRCDRCGWDFE